MKAIGFPFDRGRLDESEHPFTEGVVGDIRVTTRFDAADPFTGLLGALHETGHAMYDLGMPQSWRDQPVGRDRGMALEESQSLLLEMIVGRSRAVRALSAAAAAEALSASAGRSGSPRTCYRALTHVQRSLIRVDADEMSYPLHILLRYEHREEAAGGRARGARPARGLERRHGAAPRGAARPAPPTVACRTCTGRSARSAIFLPMRSGASSPRSCGKRCATQLPEVDTQIERGEFAPAVRLAARERARLSAPSSRSRN